MDIGTLIASSIEKAGFKAAFGVPGVPLSECLTAIRQRKSCLLNICRNEQQAANAAAAYGYFAGTHTLEPYTKALKQTFQAANLNQEAEKLDAYFQVGNNLGQPALCFSTSGPAFLNALGGVGVAQVNSFPMVLIASSTGNINNHYHCAFQEYPQMNIAEKLVTEGVFKAAFRVQSPIEIYPSIVKARHIALCGQPGVTYVDICRTVLRCNAAALIQEAMDAMNKQTLPAIIPRVQPKGIENLLQAVLEKSQKPLIIAGKGLAYSAGEPITWILSKLSAAKFPVPILTSPMGKGVISETDKRNASAARKLVMNESDCVIALGARLNWMFDPATGWTDNKSAGVFCCNLAEKLPVELSHKFVNVTGDATLVLLSLVSSYVSRYQNTGKPEHVQWLDEVNNKVTSTVAKLNEKRKIETHQPVQWPEGKRRFTGGLLYSQAFTALEQAVVSATSTAEADDILSVWLGPGMASSVTWVAEGAVSMDKSRLFLPGTVGKCRMDAATFAGMGIGMPFAMGAALWKLLWVPHLAEAAKALGVADAKLQRLRQQSFVSLIQGDSAFGFSGLEFETVFRYKLPILMTVVDNGGIYAMTDNEPGTSKPAEYQNDSVKRLQNISVMDLTPNFQFSQLAHACGGTGVEAQTLKDYKTQLSTLKVTESAQLPLLMHVRIDPMDGSSEGFVTHI